MFLGSNLQYLRKQADSMTQEKLAEKMGVSRQTVSKWEAGEVYPELPKLIELCNIFCCKLDALLRQDMTARTEGYFPVEIRRVAGFRAVQCIMISWNPHADARSSIRRWAEKCSLSADALTELCWNFPYVSEEQKKRFGLQGFALACILPKEFQRNCEELPIHEQDAADYAVITIPRASAADRSRISQGYHFIFEYLTANNLKKCAKSGTLPCFEHVYEKEGISCVDLYVHCEGVITPDKQIALQ